MIVFASLVTRRFFGATYLRLQCSHHQNNEKIISTIIIFSCFGPSSFSKKFLGFLVVSSCNRHTFLLFLSKYDIVNMILIL